MRKGVKLKVKFCQSLMTFENRAARKMNENAYLNLFSRENKIALNRNYHFF